MMGTMKKTLIFLILTTLFLTACNLAVATPVPVIDNPTRPYVNIAQSATEVTVPTATRQVRAIPTDTPAPATPIPSPTASPFECGITEGEHIQQTIDATVDYANKTADVTQIVRYRNDETIDLSEVVFAIEPNAQADVFTLTSLAIGDDDTGTEPYHTLDRSRLTVRLPNTLNPGCTATISLAFTLNIPRIGIGLNAGKGYFGYSDRQINLGHWLPTPAVRLDGTWIVNNVQTIGEQNILEQADWDVTLTVTGVSNVIVAAPGTLETSESDDLRWHYTFESARDFPISLSPTWQVETATTRNGVIVEVYHFGDTIRTLESGQVNGAAHTLTISVQAMEQFSALFGLYPYERMLVVQGDFPDGMEFSGLVYVSTNWFYSFDGGIQNYLSLITIHEVAHQWWYLIVGNDAANTPWLDEALATYSEYIYIEEYYPELRDWWWSFRVAWFNPEGAVDSDVYTFETARDYINAVYLRGVQMLQNLRDDVGTETFFEILATYAQQARGEVATAELFWSLFTPEQLENTATTRDAFLNQPDVIVPAGTGQ